MVYAGIRVSPAARDAGRRPGPAALAALTAAARAGDGVLAASMHLIAAAPPRQGAAKARVTTGLVGAHRGCAASRQRGEPEARW